MQPRAHDRAAFPDRWPLLLARIAAAADAGARLIVVPEGTVPAYVIGTEAVDPQQIEDAAHDVIRVASRTGATIVYGGARAHAGGTANTAYVVTRDGIAGFADKCFLWHFDRRWFSVGDSLEPIDTPLGKLGVFICADGRIPTIASTLVQRGAEALVVPTAWVSSGRDPLVLENVQADLMIPVRARENGVPLVAANKVGIEARSVAYCGKSQIVAADGTIVAIAPQDAETTLHGTIALGPPIVRRDAEPAGVLRLWGDPLPEAARIGLAAHADPALHALASVADADFTIDPHSHPDSDDVALVDDEAMLDPRALVAPRLAGVRLFIWNTSIDGGWAVRFARTRAAELRCYVAVLDTPRRRAFAVDPDGTLVCGTFGDFELAAFAFDRKRTDVWRVAPQTDVREALVRIADLTSGTRS
ncbi:MAG: Nitrilase/cyanide hydratase and apolipoprotein N-acyltransferase [Candidatus Eremiobacteraeota bacterium]|nr:Nitrilase/cyanide hydratase and apolipoprotein N-acyltransferase [Candidatus Eremiobacteraeota bacterium]